MERAGPRGHGGFLGTGSLSLCFVSMMGLLVVLVVSGAADVLVVVVAAVMLLLH